MQSWDAANGFVSSGFGAASLGGRHCEWDGSLYIGDDRRCKGKGTDGGWTDGREDDDKKSVSHLAFSSHTPNMTTSTGYGIL